MAEHTTVPAQDAAQTVRDASPELIRRPDPLAIITPTDFATALTSLREQAGITIRDLAKLVGATSSTLGGYFAGRHLPAMSAIPVVEKILEACGVPAGPPRQAWIDALTRVRRLPGPRPADAPVPYRGLDSYGADDAAYFFGREVLVARLVALVTSAGAAAAGPTVLVGPSGSGKSSALQAGLAARLRAGGNWEIFTCTPGTEPPAALERTLDEIRKRRLPPGSRVALIVDQFEELFTLCRSEADRQAFVRAVTTPMYTGPGIGPALTVVIALRADFYGAALGFEPLSHALQDRQVVVGPMSTTDLRRAIAEPARAGGVTIDPGLVELLLHDMAPAALPAASGTSSSGAPSSGAPGSNGAGSNGAGSNGASANGSSPNGSTPNSTAPEPAPATARPGHDPGALPLMSFALLETWQRGRRSRLTVEDYVAAGGIQGAVAGVAERVYTQLSPDLAEATRRLFLRLVAVSDETADTRRRVTAADLGLDTPQGDDTAEVLERFVAARLLTTSETTVEIAHEALLTAWPRLRGWLDADHAGLVTHRRLADAATAWQRDGRDPALLHRGGVLITAREWADDEAHARALNHTERAFLDASIDARERELRATRRRTRRMQALLAAATVLAVLTATLSAVAFTQRSAAAHDRDQALSRQLAEAANRLRHTDPSVAGQFAVMAWHTAPTSEARSALLDTSAIPLARRLEGPGGPPAAAVSGDGRVLAAAGDRGGLRLWTLGKDDQLGATETTTLPAADSQPLYAVAVTRTGSLVAAAGASGVLHLWDATDPHHLRPLPDINASHAAILGLATSPDGHTLAAVSGAGRVSLFNIDGTKVTLLGSPFALGKDTALQAVAFSADGKALAAAGSSGKVSLWTLADRAQPAPVAVQPSGPTTTITSLAFSPDGRRLLAGSKDQHVYLWQLTAAAAAPVRFDDAGSWVNSVAFSPDGALFAAGSSDHHLRVYELATRVEVADLPHPGPITAAAYLPDGRGLLSAAADGMVRIWPSPAPAAPMPTGRTFALGYLDGARLAAVTSRNALRVFDVAQPHRPRPLGSAASAPVATVPTTPAAGMSGTLATSRTGSLLAVGGTDGSVWLYQAAGTAAGAPTRWVATVPHTQRQLIESAAFSPDGKTLITGSDDGTLQVTDVSTPTAPRPLGSPVRSPGVAYTLAVSPDGQTLAAGTGTPNSVVMWSLHDREHLSQLGPASAGMGLQVYSVSFAPDGKTLAVGSADRSVRLLDTSDIAHPRWISAPLLGPGDYVYSVMFSPDGRTLAAASGDGVVRIWGVADRAHPVLQAALSAAGEAPLYAVAFDRAPGRIAAGGVGSTVLQWDLDPAVATSRVCGLAGAAMTEAEWSRYLPSVRYAVPCRS